MSAAKGILIRPSGQPFRVEACFFSSTTNAPVTAGTASASVFEVEADGTLRAVDFGPTPPTVLTTAAATPTTGSLALACQSCAGSAQPFWSATFAATNLTPGGVYLVAFTPPSGASTPAPKVVQYGQADGDLAPTPAGKVPATMAAGDGVDAAAVKATIGVAGAGLTAAPYAGPAASAIATAVLTDVAAADEAQPNSLGHLVTTAPQWYQASAAAMVASIAQLQQAVGALASPFPSFAVAGTPTATSIQVAGLNAQTASFVGRPIVLLTGVRQYEMAYVAGDSGPGATRTLTLGAGLSGAPAAGDVGAVGPIKSS